MPDRRNVGQRCSARFFPLKAAVESFRIILSIVCLTGLFAPLGAAAQGETIPNNSSKCSSNPDGMIYVAAGRHVFHQPFDNLRYVHGMSPEMAVGLPVPPRPSEPRGCPDHPLRGVGFKFSPFSDVVDPDRADTATGGSVQIIDIDPASWWDTHEVYSLSNAGSCGMADRSEVAPGLTVCRPAAASATDRKHSPFVAVVDPRHHTGPLGQPLAIHCKPGLPGETDDHVCEISYRLDQDVSIWYHFHTSLLPLSGLIAFDRELRRRISEAEVADYWWPVFPASGPFPR